MKHIRTEWSGVVYTVELTEEDRVALEYIVARYSVTANAALLAVLRELALTHP